MLKGRGQLSCDRAAAGGGQMHGPRIHRDDQVELRQGGGGIGEVGKMRRQGLDALDAAPPR